MRFLKKWVIVGVLATQIIGCTTSGTFKIPEGSQLYLYRRDKPVQLDENGRVTTRPFFWTALGIPPHRGVPYRLEKDGKTIKEGRLRAKMRVVSFFWPPFAELYWPVGLNPDITYDLVNDTQE